MCKSVLFKGYKTAARTRGTFYRRTRFSNKVQQLMFVFQQMICNLYWCFLHFWISPSIRLSTCHFFKQFKWFCASDSPIYFSKYLNGLSGDRLRSFFFALVFACNCLFSNSHQEFFFNPLSSFQLPHIVVIKRLPPSCCRRVFCCSSEKNLNQTPASHDAPSERSQHKPLPCQYRWQVVEKKHSGNKMK